MIEYNNMMVSRFFFPAKLQPNALVRLPDVLSHHAVRVLRMSDGDPLVLFDGQGGEIPGHLSVRGRDCFALLQGHLPLERESPLGLTLVQALATGDKMDWIVQKAVELGAVGVIPVEARRSVVRLSGDRAAKRVLHWEQIAVSACEQSGRNRVPRISPVQSLADYLAAYPDAEKLILSPVSGQRIATLAPPAGAGHVMIGPEGGWTDDEMAASIEAGCKPVTLGPRVLRTETAGVAVLAAMQCLWGDI